MRKVIIAAAAAAVSGCAYNTTQYGASVQNVEAIKAVNIRPVAVAPFTATKPGLASITCRAAGPVTVAPNFETTKSGHSSMS